MRRELRALFPLLSGLLAVLVCLGLIYKSRRSKVINDRIGDLRVTLRNRSDEDLVFDSYDLPWEFNAGGLDFFIYRKDGSVVGKTPMIADAMVRDPTSLKRGEELSHGMSLLVYYTDLPKELALHDLKVKWSYLPKPTNLIVAKALRGEFLLKKLTPSGENHNP